MRVAIDLRPLLEPYEGGVSIYTKFMVDELMKLHDLELDLFYQASDRCERIHKRFPGVRHIGISNRKFHIKSLLRFPVLPDAYFEKRPDLIWIPDRRPFYKTDIPLVMTFHDFVPDLYAWTQSWKGRLWHRIFSTKRLLKLSSAVMTPTTSVLARLPKDCLKAATYEGAQLANRMETPGGVKSLLKRPFFLSISPADPRKRLDWVIQMAEEFPRLNFAIVGIKIGDPRFKSMKLHKRNNLFLFHGISEEEKLWFFRKTLALLALSAYEGFDLPVLEAVRAKCPVIMSDIAVHQELYHSSENMVKDLSDLRAAIHRVKEGGGQVPKPRRDFTWKNAAKEASLFFRRVVVHKD